MSQMWFARSYPEFWTGSLSELDDLSRALAHFLFSAHGLPPFGLYYKPAKSLAHEFRRTESQVRAGLSKLCAVGYCCFDDPSGFVWVREMAGWQLKPLPLKTNNPLIKTARRWYAQLPRNPFLGPWFDRYDADLLLSNPHAFAGTEITRREWIPRPEPAPPQPLELPPPAGLERRAGVQVCGEAEFEQWWRAYPKDRHEGKKPTLEKWMRKRIPVAQLPAILATLEAQKRSDKWRSGYVPQPLTYVNQERWNDTAHQTRRPEGALNRTNRGTVDTLRELIDGEDEIDH